MARVHVVYDAEGAKSEVPFTAQEEADADAAEAAIPASVKAEEVRQTAIRSDTGRAGLLARLKAATPAQIDTYIDNNVTNIAQVRVALKAILKLIALDARN